MVIVGVLQGRARQVGASVDPGLCRVLDRLCAALGMAGRFKAHLATESTAEAPRSQGSFQAQRASEVLGHQRFGLPFFFDRHNAAHSRGGHGYCCTHLCVLRLAGGAPRHRTHRRQESHRQVGCPANKVSLQRAGGCAYTGTSCELLVDQTRRQLRGEGTRRIRYLDLRNSL